MMLSLILEEGVLVKRTGRVREARAVGRIELLKRRLELEGVRR